MNNYLLLIYFCWIPLLAMESSANRYRFDSAIDEEINAFQEHEDAKQLLLTMAKEDQDFRRQSLRAGRFYNKYDAYLLNQSHVENLKQIIEQYGWPSQENFDEDCSFAAWLIAQHANHDIDFQNHARAHISHLTERFAPLYFIFLTDRILVNENKFQLYGTQYRANGTLWPIQDPESLELRRKKMALSPMQQYQDFMALKFDQLKPASPVLPSQ